MAKKEKVDLNNLNFDFEDDWGKDSFAPLPDEHKKKNRNPVEKAGRTVLREMGKTTLTRAMGKKILEGALPPSFTVMNNNIDRSLSDTRGMFNKVKRDAGPMMREARALGRTLNRLFPTRYKDKINQLLAEQSSGFSPNDVNMEDLAATAGVNQVFGKRGPNQDQKRKAEDENGRELVKELTDQEFRQRLGNAVVNIQDLLSRQTSYNFSVQRAYQKKMMELQIRQMMISRSQLDVTQKAAVETSNLLRNIVENTGLPDVVKVRRSEEFMRQAREQLYGKTQKKLADWTRNYRENLGNRVLAGAKNKFDRFTAGFSMASTGLDQYEQQREMLESMGISPEEFAAGAAGQFGALYLGRRIGKSINRRFPQLARTDGAFSRANYLFNNKERLAAEWGRSGYNYGKWYHPVTNALKDTLRDSYRDAGTIRAGGMKGIENGIGEVEQRKLRAIEEIIPGYLSRILHSIDTMRTGDTGTKRVVFNHQKGTFTNFDESVKDVRESVLGQGEIDNQRQSIERLLTSIDPTGKMKGKGRDAVIKFLMSRARTSRAFNPAGMANENIPGVTGNDKVIWQGLLATRYGLRLGPDNEWKGDIFSGRNQNLNRDAGDYNYASNQTAGLYNRVHALGATGNLEQLIQEGAVVFKKGEWVLNQDYYERRVNGNESAPPKPGEGRRDTETPAPGRPPAGNPPPLPNGNRRFDYLGGGYPNSYGAGDYSVGATRDRSGPGTNFGAALAEQIDRILAEMKPHHLLVSEGFSLIESQLERISLSSGQGGPGTGEPAGGNPSRRRFHRLRQALSLAGRGAKGYWNLTSLPFKGAAWVARKAMTPLKSLGMGGIGHAFSYLTGIGNNLKNQLADGYIQTRDGLQKVIDREGLKAGRYIDQKTGEVIRKLSDIKGAVWDTINQTQVLTEEQALSGLFTATGQKIKTHALGLIGRAGSLLKAIVFPKLGLTRMASGLLGKGKAYLNRLPDVYVQGETTPRLYASKMMKGDYYQISTGKRVSSLADLTTDIGTLDRTTRRLTPVLTIDEIHQGLMDRNGKALRTPLGRIMSGAGRLLALPFAPLKLAKRALAGAMRFGGDVVSGAGSALRRLGGFIGGNGTGTGGRGSNTWLKKIYRLLVNQFTGKSPLEGLGEDSVEETGGNGFVRGGRLFSRAKGRTSDFLKKLGDRSGSWLNRIKGFGRGDKREHTEEVKKAESGGGWGKLILTAMGGIGTLVGGIASGFKSFFGWIKDLPKWLSLAKGATGAVDAAGGPRRKGGILRRTGRLALKGAKALGKGAVAAASFLGRGALMGGLRVLGGAAMSLLSAPVAIAAAVAVGAGYLIYKGYQAYANRMTDLREYRVAQYGFNPKESEHAGKVLALEEAVLAKSRLDTNGKLTIGALEFPELIKAFDVEVTDQRSVLRWSRWFKLRFSPIFTRNVEVLNKVDPKAKITDATFLTPGQRPQFARDTFISQEGENSPYNVSDSPFANGSCYVGSKFPASYRDKIIATYSEKEAADKKAGVNQPVAAPEKRSVASTIPRRTDVTQIPATPNKGVNAATDLYFSPGDTVSTPGGITGNVAQDELIQIGNRLDDLTAIRMKVYGLTSLVKDRVNTIVHLEQGVLKNISFGAKGVSTYNQSTDQTFQQFFGSFGINPVNPDEKNNWVFWFEHRFLPAFLNFCAQAKKTSPNTSPLDAWQRLSSEDLLKIAAFTNQTTTVIRDKRISVWTVTASPWPNDKSGTDASIIQSNLDAMRAMSKKEVYSEKLKTQAELDKMTFDGKSLKSTVVGNKIYDLTKDLGAATANGAVRGQGPNGKGAYAQHYASTGTSWDVSGAGADYVNDNITHIGEGSGGSVNTLPVPQGEGWANTKDLIVAAAKMTGVDAGSLAATIAIESNFKPTAHSGSSSAQGLGQFTGDTWKEIMPLLVKKYGINPNTPSTDPRASVLATAEYMKQNAAALKGLGRPLTTTDLYMAHFLGAGDAKKVLGVDSNTPIAQALGGRYQTVASANKEIFEQVNTTGDLIRIMGGRLAKNGGSYMDEANAMAQRQSGVSADTAGTVGLPGMQNSGSGSAPAAATPSTPTLKTSDTGGTEKTPPLPTGTVTKGPMVTGDPSSARTFNRSTDVAPSRAARPAESPDIDNVQQTNDALNQANNRMVAVQQRQNASAVSSRIAQGEATNSSIGYLKSIDGTLGEILTQVIAIVNRGTNSAQPSTAPGARTTESEKLLSGDVFNLQGGNSSSKPTKRPFDTSLNAAQYK